MDKRQYMSLKPGDIVTTSPAMRERMVLEVHALPKEKNNQWIYLEQIPRLGRTTLFLYQHAKHWMLIRRGSEKDLPKLFQDPYNHTLRVEREIY